MITRNDDKVVFAWKVSHLQCHNKTKHSYISDMFSMSAQRTTAVCLHWVVWSLGQLAVGTRSLVSGQRVNRSLGHWLSRSVGSMVPAL